MSPRRKLGLIVSHPYNHRVHKPGLRSPEADTEHLLNADTGAPSLPPLLGMDSKTQNLHRPENQAVSLPAAPPEAGRSRAPSGQPSTPHPSPTLSSCTCSQTPLPKRMGQAGGVGERRHPGQDAAGSGGSGQRILYVREQAGEDRHCPGEGRRRSR